MQDENVDQYFGHHGSAYFDEHGPDAEQIQKPIGLKNGDDRLECAFLQAIRQKNEELQADGH